MTVASALWVEKPNQDMFLNLQFLENTIYLPNQQETKWGIKISYLTLSIVQNSATICTFSKMFSFLACLLLDYLEVSGVKLKLTVACLLECFKLSSELRSSSNPEDPEETVDVSHELPASLPPSPLPASLQSNWFPIHSISPVSLSQVRPPVSWLADDFSEQSPVE